MFTFLFWFWLTLGWYFEIFGLVLFYWWVLLGISWVWATRGFVVYWSFAVYICMWIWYFYVCVYLVFKFVCLKYGLLSFRVGFCYSLGFLIVDFCYCFILCVWLVFCFVSLLGYGFCCVVLFRFLLYLIAGVVCAYDVWLWLWMFGDVV